MALERIFVAILASLLRPGTCQRDGDYFRPKPEQESILRIAIWAEKIFGHIF
jgi:hypothetical protein